MNPNKQYGYTAKQYQRFKARAIAFDENRGNRYITKEDIDFIRLTAEKSQDVLDFLKVFS